MFYAEQDVMLAPSIWPESYGLVSREALSSGLWVVASNVGALADSIEDGRNGSLFTPGDAIALARILEKLSSQHPVSETLFSFQNNSRQLHDELNDNYLDLLDQSISRDT